MHPLDLFGFGQPARRRTSICLFIAVLSICLVPFDSGGQEAVQLGETLNGVNNGDGFGASVALSGDGNSVVVGAPENDDSGFQAGEVQVFDWDGDQWVQRGSDLNGEEPNDRFGSAVAISYDGDWIAIGAPENDVAGSNAGQVRVYEWVETEWLQVGESLTGTAEDEYFGRSLATSSDGVIVIVGGRDIVKSYYWDHRLDVWNKVGQDVNGITEDTGFGYSVATSYNARCVLVGAPNDDAGYIAAYEYFFADDVAVQIGDTLEGSLSSGGRVSTSFGVSTAISSNGQRIAASRPSAPGEVGYIRVYDHDGDQWTQAGSTLVGTDGFGSQIAFNESGDLLAVSSPGARAEDGGAVLFSFNEEDEWVQIGETITSEESRDLEGLAMDLSSDGRRLALASPTANGRSGYVRIFDLEGITSNSENVGLQPALVDNIYPNPANDLVNIEFSMDHSIPFEINLMDAAGRVVSSLTETGVRGMNQVKVDVSQFPIGSYQVTVRFDGKVASGVVIVGGS